MTPQSHDMKRFPKMRWRWVFHGEERPVVVKQKAKATNNDGLPIGPHFSLQRLITAVRPLTGPSASVESIHGAPPGTGDPQLNPSSNPPLDVYLKGPDNVLAVEVID